MTAEDKTPKTLERVKKVIYNNGPSGAVYGFGFIGALIYFFQHRHERSRHAGLPQGHRLARAGGV